MQLELVISTVSNVSNGKKIIVITNFSDVSGRKCMVLLFLVSPLLLISCFIHRNMAINTIPVPLHLTIYKW